MRLIDAEALKKVVESDNYESTSDKIAAMFAIDIAPTIMQLYGHSISALIVVANLYRNKGIILEDTAKAFEAGYKMAYEEANETIKRVFESATTFEAIRKEIYNIENNGAG